MPDYEDMILERQELRELLEDCDEDCGRCPCSLEVFAEDNKHYYICCYDDIL